MSDPELNKLLDEKMKRMSAEMSTQNAPILKITTSEFDSIVNAGKPVFVDFWAVWCGPCRTMEPVVERLAQKYSGSVTFGKLNVDEESAIATRYDVQSIPTFMVFKNGKPIDAVIGAMGESALDRLIQRSMGATSVYS